MASKRIRMNAKKMVEQGQTREIASKLTVVSTEDYHNLQQLAGQLLIVVNVLQDVNDLQGEQTGNRDFFLDQALGILYSSFPKLLNVEEDCEVGVGEHYQEFLLTAQDEIPKDFKSVLNKTVMFYHSKQHPKGNEGSVFCTPRFK